MTNKPPTETLPAPLVPADVDADLRGFRRMPLDVVALLHSDFYATSTGEVFKAAISLWSAAWHQIPAGSLPDVDQILARAAGLGGNVRRWRSLRSEALHGFVRCSDGRLHHSYLARIVLETARLKKSRSKGGEIAAQQRAAQQNRQHVEKQQIVDSTSAAPATTRARAQEPAPAPHRVEKSRDNKALRASRIPEEWKPSQDEIAQALNLGLTSQEVGREADRFLDYWRAQAGSRGIKSDWSATWRNWCRNAVDRAGGNHSSGRSHSRPSARPSALDIRRRVGARLEEAQNGSDCLGDSHGR